MKKTSASLWLLLFAAVLLCVALLSGGAVLLGMEEEAAPAESAGASAESAAAPAESAAAPAESAAPPAESTAEPTDDAEEQELPEGSVTSISLDHCDVSVTVGQSDMPWVTMLPEDAENKDEIWESDDPAVATVDAYGNITGVGEGTCTVTVTSAGNRAVSAEVHVEVKPSPGLTYISGILIANKTYPLPPDYNPGVDGAANAALNEMIAAAQEEGIALWVVSGFRSYNTQAAIYSNYAARDGAAAADRYSARAGHSEHQTGLAFDLNSLDQYFGATPEGQWLAAHCWEYGFIIRYPQEKESVTGYMYEPWHVRYLGKETARQVYESGLCLEEYLGITSAYAA